MKTSELRRNTIMSAAARNGIMSQSAIAKATRLPKSTMCRKLTCPGTITVSELYLLDAKLGLTDKEIVQIVRGTKT